jgi:tetratricopeptide (TPR) repeat protein
MPGPIVAILMLVSSTSDQQVTRPNAAPSFDTLSRQAEQARDGNRLDEALALYQKALKLKPDWDEGWWNAGSIAYDQDKYAECAPAFRNLATLKPDAAPAWTMLALCEYRLRQYDSALTALLRVKSLGFQEPPELARAARLHLALLLSRSGSFETAIVELTALTRMEQKTPEIIAAAGIAGLRRPWLPAEVPEADREKVFKLGDAIAQAMERDPKGAIEKFEAAVQAYPAEPNVHFRFGAFLMAESDASDRGIGEIKKALELDPAHVPAMVGLAAIYMKRGEPEAAREYASKAVKASPGDFATHIVLGRALLETGDATGAARELELAVKLAPDNPEARFSLASAYSRLGRKADAEREHEEFKRLKKVTDIGHPQF